MNSRPIVKVSPTVNAEGGLVVSCFPSVGMVSSIVAHFLIEKLELKFVGGVRDARLPALCLIQDGAPLPPIRIYAGEPKCNMGECDTLILVMSEMQVPERLVFELVEAMFEWSKSAKIGAGVLIDAFPRKGLDGGPNSEQDPVVDYEDTAEIDVLGVGATQHMREVLGEMGIPMLEHGVLRGMSGALLGEGRRRGLDLLSILVEADPRFPDARAASKLIEHLNVLLPSIELDPEPLLEEAERLEGQLKAMMETQLIPSDGDASDGSATNSMLYG
ncbi:MAG: PAC2 family protein [Candidatus Poseidoniaceae archaeon]|nr:PAC2 family protein [Candidatus Poseidoniaceae archaeon]MDP7202899.1 PAC2 family protein [Candidatus Poseidoniaceae archaeon]